MSDVYDMQCESVTNYKGKLDKYIDPNNTGKSMHNELQQDLLDSNIYVMLKKLLVTSEELENHYKTEPKYTTPPSNIKEMRIRNKKMLEYNEKLNELMNKASNRYTKSEEFCNAFDFNDEKIPIGIAKKIPLLDTVQGKQIVLGRQRNIYDYYNDKNNFITLNSKYWDAKYFNDIFIECAIIKTNETINANKFPIRIVLSDNLFNESDTLRNITKYDINYNITSVLSKELCQILKYTDNNVYQSIEYPNIFFIGKAGIDRDPNKYKLISSTEDRYILNYNKYIGGNKLSIRSRQNLRVSNIKKEHNSKLIKKISASRHTKIHYKKSNKSNKSSKSNKNKKQ